MFSAFIKKNKTCITVLLFLFVFYIIFINCTNYLNRELFTNDDIQVIDLDKNLFDGVHTFNATIIFYNNNFYSNVIEELDSDTNFILAYRSQPERMHRETKLIVKPKNNINCINNKFSVTLDTKNEVYDYNDKMKYEDARFTIIREKPYFLYTYLPFYHDYIYENKDSPETVNQQLCEYENHKNAFFVSGIQKKTIEKNWIIFEMNSEIYLIYELLPKLVVYKLESRDFSIKKEIKNKEYGTPNFRGGTLPIVIDDNIYLFGHSNPNLSMSSKDYLNLSLVILNKNDFEPLGYCTDLLSGNKNVYPDVNFVYCRGALYVKSLDKFILSLGIDDRYCSILTLSRSFVDSKITII